jgi:hypothetical protein
MITPDRPPVDGLSWASVLMLAAAMLLVVAFGFAIEMVIE